MSKSDYYHPSPEEIAAFVDGALGEIDEARVRVHVECCENCLETYRYAARFAGSHAGVVFDDSPGAEAVRAAKALAGRRRHRRAAARTGVGRWMAGLTPAGRAVAATAVVVVFMAVAIWLWPAGGGFDPWSDSMAPVTDAMVHASERNPLVIPGAESEISAAPATVRSGPAPVTRSLEEALSAMAIEYNRGANSPDEAQWLIGAYLATGQLVNARVYLEDAGRRYPDDPDIKTLEGILAWSDSDLGRAADLFESVLDDEPEHLTALYNLAVVKKESRDNEGAREMFERVRELAPASPLAARAYTELSTLPE